HWRRRQHATLLGWPATPPPPWPACGASGRATARISRSRSIVSPLRKDPFLRRCRQLRAVCFRTRFRVCPDDRFGAAEPVADPRTVGEHELQPVRTDDARHFPAGKLARLLLQLLSKLRFHLGRQSEVLPFGVK